MKKIITASVIYLVLFIILILATLLQLFLGAATGALSALPILLVLILVLAAFGILGIVWSIALMRRKTWSWSWGVVLSSIGVLSGVVYMVLHPTVSYGFSLVFNAFVLYSLIKEKSLFFPAVGADGQPRTYKIGRMFIAPIITFILLGVIMISLTMLALLSFTGRVIMTRQSTQVAPTVQQFPALNQ
jgi:hypothetical protein